jgi:hypothetical protein
MASTTAKIATLAPMQIARVASAVAVKAGVLSSRRIAYLRFRLGINLKI